VPFLSTLPLVGIEDLAARLERVELASGEVLFERGDAGDRFYIVTEGTVEIDLPDGVKIEEAPCYVGEIALLHDIPRTATVRAAHPSVLWALERDDFLSAVLGYARSHRAADEIAAARLGAVSA
jgi:CRP-like cAMP-binding protein